MTTLSGNHIQNLLWNEGLDFTYITTEEDYQAMNIPCGSRYIRVERLWVDEEDVDKGWIIDEDDIVISLVDSAGNLYDSYLPSVDQEESLVEELVGRHEEWS